MQTGALRTGHSNLRGCWLDTLAIVLQFLFAFVILNVIGDFQFSL